MTHKHILRSFPKNKANSILVVGVDYDADSIRYLGSIIDSGSEWLQLNTIELLSQFIENTQAQKLLLAKLYKTKSQEIKESIINIFEDFFGRDQCSDIINSFKQSTLKKSPPLLKQFTP